MKALQTYQIVRTIPLLIAVCLIGVSAEAQYSGGTGEPNDPYQIATAADLILLGESPEDYDKHFILTADIDLDPSLPGRKVFDKAVIAPDTDPNDKYLWFQRTRFGGVFDGNGHTISHLTVSGNGYLGLFGLLDFAAVISNLGLEEADVNGTRCVGGLVGYNGHKGNVSSCYSTGLATGDENVGGLVGWNEGDVSSCYSTCSVSGVSSGGLVGLNVGLVVNCYSIGAATGGGLVGGNDIGVTGGYWHFGVAVESFLGH